jgi:hypothetical protein
LQDGCQCRFIANTRISPEPILSDADSDDDMNPEYDFSVGERGKFAKALKEEGYLIRVYHADGTFTERKVLSETTVVLDPDVSKFFPDSESVNRALRAIISVMPSRDAGH